MDASASLKFEGPPSSRSRRAWPLRRSGVELDQRLRDLEPGVLVADNYQLVRFRWAGARSVVWEAFHVTLERSCALKIMDAADPNDPNLAANVRRTASLSHPNIIPLHDVVSLPRQGLLAVAMPLLEGLTLSRLSYERAAVPLRAKARVVWQVADAALHMLALGYTPRRLGPEKILVCSAPAGLGWRPDARVLGLVKPIEGEPWVGRTTAEREIVRSLGAALRAWAGHEAPGFVDVMEATQAWQRPTLIEVQQLLADVR